MDATTQRITLEGPSSGVSSLAFSPIYGNVLAAASKRTLFFINTWNYHATRPIGFVHLPLAINDFTWDQHGREVVSCARYGKIWRTDVEKSYHASEIDVKTATTTFKHGIEAESDLFSIAYNSDAHLIATGTKDGFLYIADARINTVVETVPINRRDFTISSIAFSPKHRECAVASMEGLIRIYDLRMALAEKLPKRFCSRVECSHYVSAENGHSREGYHADLTPIVSVSYVDGNRLLAGFATGTVVAYDHDGHVKKHMKTQRQDRCVAFKFRRNPWKYKPIGGIKHTLDPYRPSTCIPRNKSWRRRRRRERKFAFQIIKIIYCLIRS
ncbi:hypothetical protein L596_029641 [Steinernema carpocapsae]|uniref:Uncharacterized protein n=1 Tax=Steinernema carpocapsae TaxID=34508 RepID=A0A4U5LV85_STECR|nr:hypothetical protein L596_029641 [Steinernema carpocapsae]